MTSAPRAIAETDIPWVHALNERHATELSSLSEARLIELVGRAFFARAVDERAGFLIAFDQDADYGSPNFRWFQARLPRFVYVDRVVVSAAHRGQGLAKRLYEDLFARAAARGHAAVVCEVNTVPPNPASDAFHAAMGFGAVGEARIHDGAKTVRYLQRDL